MHNRGYAWKRTLSSVWFRQVYIIEHICFIQVSRYVNTGFTVFDTRALWKQINLDLIYANRLSVKVRRFTHKRLSAIMTLMSLHNFLMYPYTQTILSSKLGLGISIKRTETFCVYRSITTLNNLEESNLEQFIAVIQIYFVNT